MPQKTHWPCRTFSIAQPEEKLPTLLRKMAREVQRIGPSYVFNIVVDTEDYDVVATIYFRLPKKRKAATKASGRRRVATKGEKAIR